MIIANGLLSIAPRDLDAIPQPTTIEYRHTGHTVKLNIYFTAFRVLNTMFCKLQMFASFAIERNTNSDHVIMSMQFPMLGMQFAIVRNAIRLVQYHFRSPIYGIIIIII